MRDAPPKIIHMPLEELLDPELSFDDPESAGENPTAYVLKTDVDEQKRQRDRLLEATNLVFDKMPGCYVLDDEVISKLRAAIAECEGKGQCLIEP